MDSNNKNGSGAHERRCVNNVVRMRYKDAHCDVCVASTDAPHDRHYEGLEKCNGK